MVRGVKNEKDTVAPHIVAPQRVAHILSLSKTTL